MINPRLIQQYAALLLVLNLGTASSCEGKQYKWMFIQPRKAYILQKSEKIPQHFRELCFTRPSHIYYPLSPLKKISLVPPF